MKILKLLFIICTLSIFTQSAILGKERYATRLSVAVFDLRTINCPESLGGELAEILRDELSVRYGFKIIRTAVSGEAINCHTIQDAIEYGRRLNADKSIIGSVRMIKREHSEKSLKISQEAYIITIRTVNLDTGREEDHYRITSERFDLRRGIISIAKELRTRDRDRAFDEALTAEDKENFVSNLYLKGLSLSAAYLKTRGDYSEIAEYGYGLTLNLLSNIIPHNNAILILSLGLYLTEVNQENIESAQIVSATLNMGYSVTLNNYLAITPHAGIGYIAHVVKGDKNGADSLGDYSYSREYLFDPSITAGCEIDFALSRKYHIAITPSYTIFFEEETTGQYLGISMGIKMLL